MIGSVKAQAYEPVTSEVMWCYKHFISECKEKIAYFVWVMQAFGSRMRGVPSAGAARVGQYA